MANPNPLDFEDVGAERSERIKKAQENNARSFHERTFNADPNNTFSTLDVKKPTTFDNFSAVPPTGFDQVGVKAPPSYDAASEKPKGHFGGGALKVIGDVREGTVKDVHPFLRPLAFPFYKAGQGALAGLEWSGNVATTVTPYAVDAIQRALPGQQKMERLIAEKEAAGLARPQAIRAAWEDHHGTWELPFKIPFATTAFTPEGSITLDFQDVAEVGFNPIDLALLFGTGGFGTGAGIAAAAVGRQSFKAGLKTAVSESMGVRGIKNISTKGYKAGRQIPSELASGGAGTRAAIAGLPSPSSILHNTRETISDVLHPSQAYEKRKTKIYDAPEPDSVAPGVLAEEDLIEQISTKDWRFDNVLNKLPRIIRGEETTRRYKAISALGQGTYDRIIKLADPSAVVGDNHVARASVIRENVAARLASQIGLGLSYISREVFDEVFNVDQFGRSRVSNISLTPAGKKFLLYKNGKDASGGFRQYRNADGKMVDMTEAELARLEKEGFMMGDIIEATLSGFDEKITKTPKTPGVKRSVKELQAASDDITFGAVFGWETTQRLGFNPSDILTHERIALLRKQEVMQRDRFLVLELDKAAIKLDELRTESGRVKIGEYKPDHLGRRGAAVTEPMDVFPREQIPDVVRSRADSYFTGLTPDQQLALDRVHKYTKDWLELAEKEGALEVRNGVRVGFKFGDEQTQELGRVGEMFHYHHREVLSKDLWDETGETTKLVFRDQVGEGFGTARGRFDNSRLYETMEEGARNGVLYAHPMEAAESMAITLSQMIADKRAMKYLKQHDIVVTHSDAFNRLFPRMTEGIEMVRKAENAALANVNRLERKIRDRKSKKSLVKEQEKSKLGDVGRRGREAFYASKAAQDQMILVVQRQLRYSHLNDRLNDLLKSDERLIKSKVVRKTYQKKLSKAKAQRNQARQRYNEAKRLFKEKVDTSYKANSRAKQAAGRLNTSANKVDSWNEEVMGITDNLEVAKKELALASATRKRLEDLKNKRMEHIVKSSDAKMKVFGETDEAIRNSQEAITHFHTGPLANAFAPTSHAKELQKTFGDTGVEALRKIEKITGTARTLAAGSADIGWMGIQGSLLAAMHPITFTKAAVSSIEAVLQPGKRDLYVVENLPDIIDFLKNGGDLGSSEFFTAIDRTGTLSSVTNWLTVKEGQTPKWMPGGGTKLAPRGSRIAKMTELWGRDVKPVGRLGAGFNTFVDISKVELWKAFNPMVSANVMTKREIASYINNVTGTLNSQMLGVRQTQRQLEGGVLLFSPRFTRSAFAVTGQAMKALTGGAKGAGQIEGLATREAVKSISGMVGAATFVLAGYARATGQWDEFKENGLNPMKPGWLTVKVGNQRVGVGGSTRALLDTIFKSAAASAELDGRQADDLMKWNMFDPIHRAKNPMMTFWLNRNAPMVRDFALGETFEGEALDTPKDYVLKGMAPKFAPFAMQEFLKPDVGQANPSASGFIAESTGLRARPMSVFERRAALRDELSRDAYGRKWEQLDIDERNSIEMLDQDGRGRLAELDELVEAVESPTVGKYFADREAVKTSIDEQLAQAANALEQHRNGAIFREEYDNIMREARNSRKRLDDKDGIHAPALEYLEGKRQARLEGETLFNQIYDEYVDTVKNTDNYEDELTGLVDWDKKDQAERRFKQELIKEFGKTEGETLYTRMRNNYVGRNADGVPFDREPDFAGEKYVFALRDARETLNSVRYWQVARDIIGDNNPAMLAVWNQYEMSDPVTQEAMKREYRELTRIAKRVERRRDRLRKNNPAVDRALMDFYGHRAKNRENMQFERTRLRNMRSQV